MRDTEDVGRSGKRQRFTKEYRRQVVEETLVPGASIAGVALQHRLNANLVFNWRRRLLPALAPARAGSVKLLPVTLTDGGAPGPAPAGETSAPSKPVRRYRRRGVIEIELNGGRLVLKGAVDAGALRVVLAGPRRTAKAINARRKRADWPRARTSAWSRTSATISIGDACWKKARR